MVIFLCTHIARRSFLACFEAENKLHPLSAKMEKKWSYFFAHTLHEAHSRPVLKLRTSYIHWQQNENKIVVFLCPRIASSSFSACFEAENELHRLTPKKRKKHRAFLGAHYSCIILDRSSKDMAIKAAAKLEKRPWLFIRTVSGAHFWSVLKPRLCRI